MKSGSGLGVGNTIWKKFKQLSFSRSDIHHVFIIVVYLVCDIETRYFIWDKKKLNTVLKRYQTFKQQHIAVEILFKTHRYFNTKLEWIRLAYSIGLENKNLVLTTRKSINQPLSHFNMIQRAKSTLGLLYYFNITSCWILFSEYGCTLIYRFFFLFFFKAHHKLIFSCPTVPVKVQDQQRISMRAWNRHFSFR